MELVLELVPKWAKIKNREIPTFSYCSAVCCLQQAAFFVNFYRDKLVKSPLNRTINEAAIQLQNQAGVAIW